MASYNLQAFLKSIKHIVPENHVLTDALSRHAYGHDASQYSLIPQVVIRLDNEAELQAILSAANQFTIPITFRAGGTSVSGQSITDSVLIVLSEHWRSYEILNQGEAIRLQAGVLGGEANFYLAPYKRKIGPDPASISSAKIGGIAANNASGMCCGTTHNSYHTLQHIRAIFADGSVLDTHDPKSIASFRQTHADWLQSLSSMRTEILSDAVLSAKIRKKYGIKNTIGYSINALLDFEDPIDILTHLLIGSEGTLAFISEITYRTIYNPPNKKAALVFFKSLRAATEAVQLLRQSDVSAIELLDGISLSFATEHLADYLPADLSLDHAALLIDVRAESATAIENSIADIQQKLQGFAGLCHQSPFMDGKDYARIWQVREGYFPLVATMRAPGRLVIIEDIAVPLEHLPDAVDDLKALFKRVGFEHTSLFGHARDGNLHFVLDIRFDVESELKRYQQLMTEMAEIIVRRYDGSLKAEHGTGRNMAAFVEYEWGPKAYQMMWQLKQLLDPCNILNREVILSHDPSLHLKDLKFIPEVNAELDKCLECGFCEKVCPSRDLTLTPRQRIVSIRSMEKLKHTQPEQYQQILKSFDYAGAETCAATGMCGEVCPVGINTGKIIKNWRAKHLSVSKHSLWKLIGRYQNLSLRLMGLSLKLLRKLPQQPSNTIQVRPATENKKVVLYPSCSCRLVEEVGKQGGITSQIESILTRLGYQIIYPNFSNACCGLMFMSEGVTKTAHHKREKLLQLLQQASEQGKWPIITENASCALELKSEQFSLVVQDAIHFIAQALAEYPLKQKDRAVMLHVNCSISRLHEKEDIIALAKRCAKEVIVPPDIYCCGYAGSKGITTPELNANALKTLKAQIPHDCQQGYTCLQTCEIGLTKHSGIPYHSILNLVADSMN